MSYQGESIPKLGFGLMRLPRLEEGAIDVEQVKQMVDLFLEAGCTYFDTARAYGDSEDFSTQSRKCVEVAQKHGLPPAYRDCRQARARSRAVRIKPALQTENTERGMR